MAKPIKSPSDLPRSKPEDRLAWPQGPRDLCERPRLFRIERLDAFAWQAYVTEGNQEHPIGKPDVFDILRSKVAGVMRAEGQLEFFRRKAEAAKKETPGE